MLVKTVSPLHKFETVLAYMYPVLVQMAPL